MKHDFEIEGYEPNWMDHLFDLLICSFWCQVSFSILAGMVAICSVGSLVILVVWATMHLLK